MIKDEERQQVWFEHIKSCELSGLTQPEFCRQNNLSINTFVYYRGQYLSQQKKSSKASRPWMEIPALPTSTTSFALSFPNGIKLCLPQQLDTQQLSKLIEVLKAC